MCADESSTHQDGAGCTLQIEPAVIAAAMPEKIHESYSALKKQPYEQVLNAVSITAPAAPAASAACTDLPHYQTQLQCACTL
jgi:hypothetical protein